MTLPFRVAIGNAIRRVELKIIKYLQWKHVSCLFYSVHRFCWCRQPPRSKYAEATEKTVSGPAEMEDNNDYGEFDVIFFRGANAKSEWKKMA